MESPEPRPGEARLGPWRIRPTQILLRRRHGFLQQLALLPPRGFSGRVRLAVIAGERRDEFVQAWNGESQTPMLFAVRLADDAHGQPGRADLLIESEASPEAGGPEKAGSSDEDSDGARAREGDSPRPAHALSGTLTFARAAPGARIYVCPLLPPPEGQLSGLPAVDSARLLKSALGALEHGRRIRAAWAADWSARIAGAGLAARVRALAATGRLEFLVTGECAPPTLADLELPASPRTGWLIAGRTFSSGSDARDIAQWLVSEVDLPPMRLADPLERVDAAGETSLRLPAGHPFRWVEGDRRRLAHEYRPGAVLRHLQPAESPAAALHFDDLVRHGLRWRVAATSGPRAHTLSFCPLILPDESAWQEISGFLGRWNRRHLSPALVPATPADYFAAVEELEAAGAVRLPLAAPGGSG